ncbi:hypothetical protein G6F56_014392 [Rhizopus delemar]|nr:hypothetical protein G6F56_014392 [Rhizopus delemar]
MKRRSARRTSTRTHRPPRRLTRNAGRRKRSQRVPPKQAGRAPKRIHHDPKTDPRFRLACRPARAGRLRGGPHLRKTVCRRAGGIQGSRPARFRSRHLEARRAVGRRAARRLVEGIRR